MITRDTNVCVYKPFSRGYISIGLLQYLHEKYNRQFSRDNEISP